MSDPGLLVCPVCGTPPVPGARFCHNCGALLDSGAGPADTETERRVVTVLFGDLSDFTAWAEDVDPERVGEVTDQVLDALSEAVTEMGGRVDKLTGDGIMAVFGAPVAHEDDVERAVRAAARMQSDVRALMADQTGGGRRMGLRVGLNTGEALAGVQAHRSYTVVGDTVNTASRLSDAASVGSVYVGRDTALATMAIASWRALPPLRLKGKRDPVPAYELVALRPPGAARLGLGDEAPFIGRDAEFGRLVGKLLDAAERRRPAGIVVTGEAGVGKTRLVVELSRFATELPAARVLWGRCTPYGEARDLAPVAEWVRTACGIRPGDDPHTAEDRVRRTVARLAHPAVGFGDRPLGPAATERLLALLGLVEWAPIGPRDNATPGSAEPASDPVLDAVLALLLALAADGPLVLVVDDAQWGTPDLLTVVGGIAARLVGPVLLVVVGRNDVYGESWWQRLPDAEALPVAPLDDAASERLLHAYLGVADLDEQTREDLLTRAQGNPFFLAELLHLLVDRGLLVRTGAAWELLGELPPDVLPAGVQAVLAARIDTLDPWVRAVLRDASIIGSRVTLEMLAALRDDSEAATVESAVEDLVARGILRPDLRGDRGEAPTSYVFTHALARDVAYAGIPKVERSRRHARVATWAATALTWPAGEVDALVAGQAEQAVRLADERSLADDDAAWSACGAGFAALERMGQAALARDDNPRAEGLFTRALAVAGHHAATTEIPIGRWHAALVGRAAARVSMHRLDDAESDLQVPLAARDLRQRAAALVVLGDLRRRRGDEIGATQALVSALATASDAGLDRVAGEALRQLGMVDLIAGRLASAENRFGQALAVAERVGDLRGAGWALQHLAWSATTRGDYALAEQTLDRAGALFAALDDDGGLSWCAGTEALVRLFQGRFHEARHLAQGLLPLGRSMGDVWGSAACLTIGAFAAAELGQITTAIDEAVAAQQSFAQAGDSWGRTLALVAQAVALRGASRQPEAVAVLEEAVGSAKAGGHPVPAALALGVLGYCRLDTGDAAGADLAATEALDVISAIDVSAGTLLGLRVLQAQARRFTGELADAADLLREMQAATEPSLLFPRRQALAHLAGTLLDDGQPRAALAVAGDAVRTPAEDIRSRVVAWRALASALAANGDGTAAVAAATLALATAHSTEMTAEIAATERVVEAVSGPGG